MSNDTSHPRAVFGTAKKNVPGVLFRSQAMHDGIVANAGMFGSPTVTMVVFLALIGALATTQQNALGTKAKGTAALRNTKRDAVWTAMESLQKFVQGLADVLTVDGATSLIQAAGLRVAAAPKRHKAVLAAMLTTMSGVVHLVANASALTGKARATKNMTFNWQWSDDGGKSWTHAGATPLANTDIANLALMSTYSFRVSVTVGKVTGAWSHAVSLVVH